MQRLGKPVRPQSCPGENVSKLEWVCRTRDAILPEDVDDLFQKLEEVPCFRQHLSHSAAPSSNGHLVDEPLDASGAPAASPWRCREAVRPARGAHSGKAMFGAPPILLGSFSGRFVDRASMTRPRTGIPSFLPDLARAVSEASEC